jgi:3-oxoacyl-[acyl-carrier protein] reductase
VLKWILETNGGVYMLINRVAIVTGAAHGIGKAIVLDLVKNGAIVYACDILKQDLDETVQLANSIKKDSCFGKVVDVSDSKVVNDFIKEIRKRHNQLDIIVNNAGGVAGQVAKPIEEVSDKEWKKIFQINLDGAFNFIRAAAPIMKKQRKGAIINISSGAGRSYSLTGIQAYASSKAGLIGLTRQTARELGEFNIRVNCIAPGFIRSNPASEKQWQAMGKEGQQRVLDSIALKTLGDPEDIAHMTSFFASDLAKWITGQTISVDGGHWMLG